MKNVVIENKQQAEEEKDKGKMTEWILKEKLTGHPDGIGNDPTANGKVVKQFG